MLKWWSLGAGALLCIALFFVGIANSQILRFSGASTLPPLPSGVTQHAIDGGPNYMAGQSLSNATASFQDPSGTVYSNGWDSPGWFAHMIYFGYLQNGTQISAQKAANINGFFAVSAPVSGILDSIKNNNFQLVMGTQFMGQYISVDRAPGSETAGLWLWDEPGFAEQITAQVQGYSSTTFSLVCGGSTCTAGTPSGGIPILGGFFQYAGNNNGTCAGPCMVNTPFISDGGVNITPNTYYLCTFMGFSGTYQPCTNGGGTSLTFVSEPVTQIAYPGYDHTTQDGRFLVTGMNGSTFFFGGNISSASGSVPGATFVGTSYTAPSGKTRHLDMFGADTYWLVAGRNNQLTSSGNNQTLSNIYDTSQGSPPMTLAQASGGWHYGDAMDLLRHFVQTSSLAPTGIKLTNAVETGNCICSVPIYNIQPVEMAWGAWAGIIHGSALQIWFDNDGSGYETAVNGGPENLYIPYYQNARSVTFSGSISGTTLTVTSTPNDTVGAQTQTGNGILAPGMVATSGVTGASTIAQQLTLPATATFHGLFSGTNNTTLTVSSVTGTIITPGILTGTVISNRSSSGTNIVIRSGGPTVYTVDPNFVCSSGGSGCNGLNDPTALTTTTPAYGGQGTYKISGGSGSGTFTYQQQFARGNNAQAAMSNTALIAEVGQEIKDMAAVINSPFAYGYVSVNPPGYRIEDGFTNQTCSAGSGQTIQTFAYGTCTGIEVMAKYYTGGSYMVSTGETITNGFYVFADTRFPSTSIQADIGTVTFTLGTSGCNSATTATVIGESRTRPISGCTFTDTFPYAWTYHIYKIQ